jgi:hypothetical protein
MTLFEGEDGIWGGSPITADCPLDAIEALWSHLQSRHCGLWLHDSNCIIHTHESFRSCFGPTQEFQTSPSD